MQITDNQLRILVNAAYKQLLDIKERELGGEKLIEFENEFENTLMNLNTMIREYNKLEEQLHIELKMIRSIEESLECSIWRSPGCSGLAEIKMDSKEFKSLEIALRKKHDLIVKLPEESTKAIIEERILMSEIGNYSELIESILKEL